MPNNIYSSPSYQDIYFIIQNLINNYSSPTIINDYQDPYEFNIINNDHYAHPSDHIPSNSYYNDSPNGSPSSLSNSVLNHIDDQDLYESSSSDDGYYSPIGINESSNHFIP